VPEPPSNVLLCGWQWDWSQFKKESDFHALLNVYGEYFKIRQDPGTVEGSLFTLLKLNHRANGKIGLIAQIDADWEDAQETIEAFVSTVDDKVKADREPLAQGMGEHPPLPAHFTTPQYLPWLTATQNLNVSGENLCGKYKSAYIREPFTKEQISSMWAYLGNKEFRKYRNANALIQIDSYGSAVNREKFKGMRTAVQQRDSIMKMQYQVFWPFGTPETEHLDWIRKTYAATFSTTGGVPEVGTDTKPLNTDGCYINYPDVDLSDEHTWNTSGQKWWHLYYKHAYPALRAVKKHWDPENVFHHGQSIEPAEEADPTPPKLPDMT
jgi:hypothetical protein